MAPHEDVDGREEALRRLAEAAIGETGEPTSEAIAALSPEETRRMLHELRVHQIELWMQNEELQRVQRELEANRLRYYELYNHAPVGYCTLDGAGRILEGNLTLGRLLGVVPEKLIGRTFAEFIHPDDQDTYYLYGKGLPGNGTPGVCEIRLFQEGDAPFWARVESARVPDGGDCLGTRMVLGDITAQRQLEIDKRMLDVRLQQAQTLESLGRLAGGVAHDMNNVLAAVLGLAELHQERLPEGDPTRRALETIARASLRGRSLVQGLLDFARQGLPEARLLDLAGVAEEQVALLERTALKNLQVVRDYAPDLAPVKGDPAALGHALMNVLVNASHAMPGGGTLTLRARNRDGGGTELQVQDTGTGMSPDILTRAMDPFFTTKPQGEGTGLGLAIVYATIKGHRGEILLESEPGQGTTVTLRFPTALRQEPGEGAPRGLQTLPEGRRILVVDDDPLVHASLGGMLERLGLEVHRATSGEEALRLLEAGDLPHALILDLNMPGMGGAACLAELRRRWPDLPVLISTGRLDEAARTLLAAHPGVGSLPKPYTRAELQEQLLALWHRGSRPRDP